MEDALVYCDRCGSVNLTNRIPAGDDRERQVCTDCGKIHYRNPKLVVGCIPIHEGKILLCRRNIEPRLGYWTIPSGFMENGESVEKGAARECHEESGAIVVVRHLHTVYSLPQIHQVYMIFLADVTNPEGIHITHESSEVGFFAVDDIPWSELAFAAVEFALRKYVENQTETSTHLASLPAHYKKLLSND